MSKLLLDSSLIIDLLRRKNKEESLLYQLLEQHNLYISIIVYAELYSGKSVWEHKDAGKELEDILQNIGIIPLDKIVSKKAGNIRAKEGVALLDAIIAATAISHKLDLATLNVKDFEKIKGIKLFLPKI